MLAQETLGLIVALADDLEHLGIDGFRAIALLAFRRLAMPDNRGALAMGTMQDLDNHGFPSRAWVILFGP